MAAANGHGRKSQTQQPLAEAESRERAGGEQAKESPAGGTFEHVVALLAPGTLLGALMYYFGWARTHAFYGYFGIDADSLGFSATDYILRSATALWPPLVAAALIFLVAQCGLVLWGRYVTGKSWAGRLRFAVILPMYICAIVLMVIAGYKILFSSSPLIFTTPLYLAGGFALAAYARGLARPLDDRLGRAQSTVSRDARAEVMSSRVLWATVALALFWAAALFADNLGRDVARHLESTQFAATPDIMMYSKDKIHFNGDGVQEEDLGSTYSPYRFRYEGLKLLVRGGGKFVIIPYSWRTENAFAVIVPDDKDVRIVFSPTF
ncbi:hypothetical protein ACI780_24190 [Geodermatophilus sp. SYSU D00814]